MDTGSIIAIVVAIIVVYFFIKLVVSPFLKAVVGVVVFFATIYLLQRFFGFSLDSLLSPLGIHLNLDNWSSKFNWVLGPANYYIDQIKIFLNSTWAKFPKPTKP